MQAYVGCKLGAPKMYAEVTHHKLLVASSTEFLSVNMKMQS